MAEDNKIGEKIRQLRESKEMSVEDLAKDSGNSAELIESLEEGSYIPSMAPLFKIARALGVRLGTLLDDMSQTGPFVSKPGKFQEVTHSTGSISNLEESKLELYSLAYGKSDRHMEPFIVDLHPKKVNNCELTSHEGEEFIYVMDGDVELCYGQEKHVLGAGDSIYYDLVIPHDLQAHQDEARILAVVYAPL